MQEYRGLKNKQQLQILLKIVQKHRKKFPGGRKKTSKEQLLKIGTLNIVEKTITIVVAVYRSLRLIF